MGPTHYRCSSAEVQLNFDHQENESAVVTCVYVVRNEKSVAGIVANEMTFLRQF